MPSFVWNRSSLLLLVLGACAVARAQTPCDLTHWFEALPPERGFPPEVARVLFAAPVNAVWAAKRAAEWRTLGVGGFLFEGIVDSLDLPTPKEGVPPLHALGTELAAASLRLAEAGIARNFLRVVLAPEDAYFTDAEAAERAAAVFTAAGKLCAQANLRGIAIDTRPGSFLYDSEWIGHAGAPEAALADGARAFSRRILRAFLRECPNAEVLVLCGPLLESGPIWFALLEGLLEAFGAAADLRLHLLVRESVAETAPEALAALAARLQWRLDARLSAAPRAAWRRQGSLAFGLAPMIRERRGFSPRLSEGQFRVQLAAARLLSPYYVWVDAGAGGWWAITEAEARGFRGPLQRGPARVRAADLAPGMRWPDTDFSAWRLTTPLDALRRVGPMCIPEGAAFVLHDDGGAALFAPAGLPEGLTLEHTKPVAWTELAGGARVERFARGGVLRIPPISSPCLVEGLPLRPYAMPASMWMRFEEPPAARVSSASLQFGIQNLTGVSLDSVLTATPPARFSLGNAVLPLRLEPGAGASFRRSVQGRFEAGIFSGFSLSLAMPGGAIQRGFTFGVMPASPWKSWSGTGAAGPPVLVNIDRRPGVETIATWIGGTVTCHGPRGDLLWQHRTEAHLDVPAVAGVSETGAPFVAAMDVGGTLHVLDAHGAPLHRKTLRRFVPTDLQAVDLFRLGATLLVAAGRGGKLLCVNRLGDTLWTRDTPGERVFLAAKSASFARENIVCAAHDGIPSRLLRLDLAGNSHWRRDLRAAPSCPPLLLQDEEGERIAVADNDGGIDLCSLESGGRLRSAKLDGAARIAAWDAADVHPEPGIEIIALTADAIVCLSRELAPLWKTPLRGGMSLAIVRRPEGARIVAVASDGMLLAVDGAGSVLWVAPALTAGDAAFLTRWGYDITLAGRGGLLRPFIP